MTKFINTDDCEGNMKYVLNAIKIQKRLPSVGGGTLQTITCGRSGVHTPDKRATWCRSRVDKAPPLTHSHCFP